jgi:hypothetical protein
MRECAKLGCREPAAATVGLRYADRILWIGDLLEQRDPNLIDLCVRHADTLVAPYGWDRIDERLRVPEEGTLAPVMEATVEPVVEITEATPAFEQRR